MSIHIKKANRGKFTSYANSQHMSVQEAAHHVMAHSNNPILRKRAQFAINAAKWHGNGGTIYANGGEIGSLVGSGIGLAAGALIPGAQPFIPALTSLGSKAGNIIGNQIAPITQPNTPSATPVTAFGYANGGTVLHPVVNAEKKELIVKNGQIKKDLAALPKHPEDGTLDPNGNVQAQVGDVIIPAYMRDKYINGGITERTALEKQVSKERSKYAFARGGKIKYADGGNVYAPPGDYYPNGAPPDRTINYDAIINNGQETPEYLGNSDSITPPPASALAPSPTKSSTGLGLGTVAMYAAPYIDNVGNAVLTAMTPKLNAPILNNHIQLSKKLNVEPQIQDIEANRRAAMSDIASRTNSGSVYRANAANLYNEAQSLKNKVYADANNYRNGLTNQEITANAQIDASNNILKNTFNREQVMRKDDIDKRISDNLADVSSDLQGQVYDSRLMNADIMKTAMMYNAFNTDGVLDRAKVQQTLANNANLTPTQRQHLIYLLKTYGAQ